LFGDGAQRARGARVSDIAFVNAYLNPAFESNGAIARSLGLHKSSIARRAEALGLPPREELLSGRAELPVSLRKPWPDTYDEDDEGEDDF
jgi:hypothetical protein